MPLHMGLLQNDVPAPIANIRDSVERYTPMYMIQR